ncbi:MAG: DNA-binding response regulator [Gammaproteobacteria bacterium 28-57-27]|nr:MAG: DNA-binding response regulator [Gammaproteobacteria bacterium 28-57-27]
MKSGLILEDLPESRHWLAQALVESFPGIDVTSSVGTVFEARQLIKTGLRPDIALIDLGLPDGSGIEIIEALGQHSPTTLCIVASIFDDDKHVFPALRAGARGYLLKDQPIGVIVRALNGIAAGDPPISPAIARRMLNFFHPPIPEEAPPLLTERETEVLQLISKGLTQAESGRILGISQHTVSGYVKDIYRKLNVTSRAEAALRARDMGLV